MHTALVLAPILQHYHKELETIVKTNASDRVIAEILLQWTATDKPWHPVGYFSKTISPAELNYQIYNKEILAIVKSLAQWRANLAGADK